MESISFEKSLASGCKMMEQILTEESVSKTMLKGLTLKELKDFFIAAGEKKFRGDQVFEWIYMHMAENFDDMSTIPNYLRKKLKSLL